MVALGALLVLELETIAVNISRKGEAPVGGTRVVGCDKYGFA